MNIPCQTRQNISNPKRGFIDLAKELWNGLVLGMSHEDVLKTAGSRSEGKDVLLPEIIVAGHEFEPKAVFDAWGLKSIELILCRLMPDFTVQILLSEIKSALARKYGQGTREFRNSNRFQKDWFYSNRRIRLFALFDKDFPVINIEYSIRDQEENLL